MLKEDRGITLVEIILTVAILGIVTNILSSIFIYNIKSFEITTSKGLNNQDERLIVTKVTKELKTAQEVKSGLLKEQDEKYIWKELSKEDFKVDSIKFTRIGKLLMVEIEKKDRDKLIKNNFTVLLENVSDELDYLGNKRVYFRDEEKIIYSHKK